MAAFLVGVAAVGCAKHDGAGASEPAATSAVTQASDLGAATPALAPTQASNATAPDPAPPNASGAEATTQTPTTAPVATADPLDGQFSSLDNLMNGINGSLSSSDGGTSGGE